jgi:serine/threonine protein kinase
MLAYVNKIQDNEYSKFEILGRGLEGVVYKISINNELYAVKKRSKGYKRHKNEINDNIELFYNWSVANPHRNITKIFAYDNNYEVYEYIEPYDCELTDDQKQQLCSQFLDVLIYLHSNGFCHNDIYGASGPSFIITKHGNEIVLKLIDFGAFSKAKDAPRNCPRDIRLLFQVLEWIFDEDINDRSTIATILNKENNVKYDLLNSLNPRPPKKIGNEIPNI